MSIVISDFNMHELFPGFICASNIGSLVNNLFEVKVFSLFSSIASSSPPSSGGISDKSTILLY